MFSVLISRRAVSRRPHCVYLEKQNKIVCIIRSATRAALEGSPAGSFRLQRAPAAVDPQPLARPTTTSSHWDGLWGAQMCSLPAACPRTPAPQCSSCTWGFSQGMKQRAGLAARCNPCQDRDSPTGRTRLPRNGHSCPSAAAQSLAAPASPPASHQRGLSPKLGCFPAVSVWGTFFLPQSLPHGREFRQSCPASPKHHRARDTLTASSDWNHREVFPAVHGWLTDPSSSSCDPTTSLEMVILVREAASSDR